MSLIRLAQGIRPCHGNTLTWIKPKWLSVVLCRIASSDMTTYGRWGTVRNIVDACDEMRRRSDQEQADFLAEMFGLFEISYMYTFICEMMCVNSERSNAYAELARNMWIT